MIPHLLDALASLNVATIGWSACLATGIFLLLPRRQETRRRALRFRAPRVHGSLCATKAKPSCSLRLLAGTFGRCHDRKRFRPGLRHI